MATDEEQLVLSISADTRQILNAIKKLEGDIGRSTRGIEKQFNGIGKAIDKSIDTSMQRRINESVGIASRATKEWTGALAEQGREMERMRARFNPIFAVITRYKATVVDIQTAHRLGAISAEEMTSAMQRERQAALSSIAALKQRNAVLADTPAVKSGAGNFNTANIAAQFQDIGVTAAMGMSPLQIALQQGTQLSAVLNGMGSARGVIAGLGAAFASIINPVSLVTIGVVALTAAAVQYFMTFANGSDENKLSLEEEAALIDKVAARWGSALPAVKAYADERRRALDLADSAQATSVVIDKAFEEAGKSLTDFLNLVSETRPSFFDQQAMNMVDDTARLQQAFGELGASLKEGKATTEQYQRVQEILSRLVENTAIPTTGRLREAVDLLAQAYRGAANAARQASDAQKSLAVIVPNSPLGALSPVFSHGGKFINESELQTVRANATKSKYQLEQERLAKQVKQPRVPKRTADDRFFEDIEAIRQRTQALAEEQAMIGMSFEAQTKRKIAFDLETQALKDVREEARRKGDQDWQNKELTPEQVAAIDEVSAAYARQAESYRKSVEGFQLQRDVMKGALGDLRSALQDGKLTWGEIGDVAMNALDKIIDKIENDLVDAIMKANSAADGGGSGGLLNWLAKGFGSIFGFGGSSASLPSSAPIPTPAPRARGGPVRKGSPYIVGEDRPELFVPDTDGVILPSVPSARSGPKSAAANSNLQPPVVNIINQGQPVSVERQQFDGRQLDIYINSKVDERLSKTMKPSLEGNYGLSPKLTRRS